MGCIHIQTKVTQEQSREVPHSPINRFEQFIKDELGLQCKVEEDYYRAINHLFGDGTMLIPVRFYDKGDGSLMELRSGRSRSEFIPEAGPLGKYHCIFTIIMPNDQVHVIIIDDVVVENE